MNSLSQISNTYKSEYEKDKTLQEIEDKVNTVDCKDWNLKIDLSSHPLGTPQIKPQNEKFQGVSSIFSRKSNSRSTNFTYHLSFNHEIF